MAETMENISTQDEKKKKSKWIILILVLLGLFLTLTIAILTSRLHNISPDDSEAIALVPEGTEGLPIADAEEQKAFPDDSADSLGQDAEGAEQDADARNIKRKAAGKAMKVHRLVPDFEVSDSTQIWTTETEVNIFRYSYVNNQNSITVNTDDGDKVIAPGTENSYTFKLKNTGDVPMDYTVLVKAYVTPSDIKLPVQARMKGYDGRWLLGPVGNYADVLGLDGITDSAVLGVNQYATYRLDWRWPFEYASDEYDTWLGNEAVNRDITLTIVIETVASTDADLEVYSGSVKTGDDNNIIIYVLVIAGACILLFLLLFFGKKRNEEEDEKTKPGKNRRKVNRK